MKYVMIALALGASLSMADFAEARGRRGCASCCAGGACDVKGGPVQAPVQKGASVALNADTAVVVAPVAATQSNRVVGVRLFGRRR